VQEFLIRPLNELAARAADWLSFRIVVQPSMAALAAFHAARRDVRAKQPPFLRAILSNPAARSMLLRQLWTDIARLSVLAFAVDAVYQLVVLQAFHPLQALIVAGTLTVLPYVLLRGPISRLLRWGGRREIHGRRRHAGRRDRAGCSAAAEVPRQGHR